MDDNYLFTSPRLGFRNWRDSDLEAFHAMNTDPEVMQFFPFIPSRKQTARLMDRMQVMFDQKGYCYYAVEKIEDSEFIGFIGLAWQTYEADFTPCTDIGWRLIHAEWGKGYATEGAKRCLEEAFSKHGLATIKSVAAQINLPSINVMEKIGMHKAGTFEHPKLTDYPHLKTCVLYEISNPSL